MTSRSTGCLVLALAATADLAGAQTVREKVAVEVITVRLTARDASGKRVEDLKASDLALTVDGEPVAIETFSGPGPASSASVSTEEAPPAPSGPEMSCPDLGETRTLIFVDEGQTHSFDRRGVLDELDRFVGTAAAGSQFLVLRFDGTRLRAESPWTSDTGAVLAAIERIRRHPAANRLPGPNTVASELGFGGVTLSFTSGSWIGLYADRLNEALLEAIATFPRDPAERRLLLISAGTTLVPTGEPGFGGGRVAFELWSRSVNGSLSALDVVSKAIEQDVALVPVRAEALDRGDFDLSHRGQPVTGAGGPAAVCPFPVLGPGTFSPSLDVGQTMTRLAESTGGEPILAPRATSARLQEIAGRATYTLTFRDSSGDHRFHRIGLTSERPGVKIDYRRGYRIPGEDERTLDTVVAGFMHPRALEDPMSTSITPSKTKDSKGRVATKLVISFAPPLETGAPEERPIDVIAVGEDRDGNRTEPVEWSGTASREDGGAAFEAAMLLNVPPSYVWSVAVRDQPTGLTSYVFVPAAARN